jgi:hypothetical protein
MGWARANVLYDKGPMPRFGTLAEAAHLLIWKSRTSMKVAETRAVAQAALGGDSATEAFKDYQDIVNKATVEKEKKSMHSRLEDLKKMQMVKFRPAEGTMGSGAPGGSKGRLKTVRRRK